MVQYTQAQVNKLAEIKKSLSDFMLANPELKSGPIKHFLFNDENVPGSRQNLYSFFVGKYYKMTHGEFEDLTGVPVGENDPNEVMGMIPAGKKWGSYPQVMKNQLRVEFEQAKLEPVAVPTKKGSTVNYYLSPRHDLENKQKIRKLARELYRKSGANLFCLYSRKNIATSYKPSFVVAESPSAKAFAQELVSRCTAFDRMNKVEVDEKDFLSNLFYDETSYFEPPKRESDDLSSTEDVAEPAPKKAKIYPSQVDQKERLKIYRQGVLKALKEASPEDTFRIVDWTGLEAQRIRMVEGLPVMPGFVPVYWPYGVTIKKEPLKDEMKDVIIPAVENNEIGLLKVNGGEQFMFVAPPPRPEKS